MTALAYTPVTDKDGKSTSTGYGGSAWIISLLLVLGLIPLSFGIYMCLYTAARKTSSLYYCCFFPLAGALIIFSGLCALGV